MRTKFLTLFCCLLSLLSVSTAKLYAEGADWYYDKPIRSITFQGLKNIKTSDLDGITSGFIGKKFSDDVFADLLNRIYALDYFDEVSPNAVPGNAEKSSVSILFTVTERPVITKITYKGNKQIRNSELKDAVTIKEKDIFIRSKMLIDERAIRIFRQLLQLLHQLLRRLLFPILCRKKLCKLLRLLRQLLHRLHTRCLVSGVD